MMAAVPAALWWMAAVFAVAASIYILMAVATIATWRPRNGPGWDALTPVTVLKPLCGSEDGLEEALASFLAQETASPVHFVFGAADAADPGLALARRVAERFPAQDVTFVADAQVHGGNPKVSNLINMARGSPASAGAAQIVMISDADTVIAPGTLQAVIDRLATPGVGAVTTLYHARPGIGHDRVRQFGAWYVDHWFLPMQLLNARLSPVAQTYGPLTAVRREVFERIGGLTVLADHLCDDAELGRRVHEAGYEVALSPVVAETLINDAGLGDLFERELRWTRPVLGMTRSGYVASVVSHPGPLLLPLLLWPDFVSLALLLGPFGLRWLLAFQVERRFGRSPGLNRPGPVAICLRDTFCLAVWAAGFLVGRVGWRGRSLAIEDRDLLRRAGDRSEKAE